mmetsp:Transcript_86767/g.225402  ORF Transcript_86767/g.225402 Transcript_86767/m.225402 type:complete len:254 (+) Transcript_86767:33-794(+)
MALRGDFQGGSHGGANQGLSLGGPGDHGNVAIEKYLRWNWAFFIGACLVFACAVGTAIHWLGHFTFAPATFFFEIFLLLFGAMMIVLDTPIPHMQKHPHIQQVRFQIYKFALFMTRFIGRGVWYLFLATLIFGALWDTGINWFLGAVSTLYLSILGIVAIAKGWILTRNLDRVRSSIMDAGYAAERYISRGQAGVSKEQFKLMVESATNNPDLFTSDELEYIINALSFTPYNDGQVTLDEMRYWLSEGPPLWV